MGAALTLYKSQLRSCVVSIPGQIVDLNTQFSNGRAKLIEVGSLRDPNSCDSSEGSGDTCFKDLINYLKLVH